MQELFLIIIFYVAQVESQVNASSSFNETKIVGNCSERLNLECIDDELRDEQSSIIQLFAVTALSGLWVIYLTYYNSRFIGFILSKIINQFFVKDAYIGIGSLSFSVLSGKLMFRDVCYITKDQSFRVHDGYCIFRWWRPYEYSPWRKQSDLKHGHTRLSIVFSGVEYHVYNRTNEYERLKGLFNQKKETDDDVEKPNDSAPSSAEISWWRTLFPVIKFSISYGRMMFGNRLLPNTLVVAFTDGDFQYKTSEPTNIFDLFLHTLDGTLGSLRVMLVPSLGYDPSVTPAMLGIVGVHNEPPPRKMGEGYVVAHSNNVVVKYHWDETGIVKDVPPSGDNEPFRAENIFSAYDATMVDGPLWEMTLQFGKHTTLNYGPWADRQRELIWKFFFPPDYQNLKVSETLQPGDRRIAKNFKLSAILFHGADADVLFTQNEEVHALQINMSEGSFIEVNVPMIVNDDGYKTTVTGNLLHVEAATSMQYRSLLKTETFGFTVTSHYPITWNETQTWHCDITTTKASASLLFAHKDFISDLMSDWSSPSPPDLMFFVPYTFSFKVCLDEEFELFLPMNQYNWIDCNSKPKDNAYLGLFGKQLMIDFTLPFQNFIPPTFRIPFIFHLDEGQLCIFLPESNMSRTSLLNLAAGQKSWNQGDVDWNKITTKSWGVIKSGWVPCWDVPSLDITITYTWHPIVMSFEPKQMYKAPGTRGRHSSIKQSLSTTKSTNEKKDKSRTKTTVTFDPTTLEADEIRIDLAMRNGSTLVLYGTVLDLILAFKENYLGYDDMYTDFSCDPHSENNDKKSLSQTTESNLMEYRPLQVTVNINLENVSGILPIYPNTLYASQPKINLKLLAFEMDKNYLQTRLQLLLSDLVITVEDLPGKSDGAKDGCICLNDLQFRGHAMFSGAGMPLGATTIEYAWLTEILIGAIKGNLSVIQVKALFDWGETFVFLLTNEAHQLKKAFPYRTLPTGITWDYIKKNGKCVDELDVKYLMTRLRIDSIHVRLTQHDSLLDAIVSPVTVSNGNVQDRGILEAISIVAEEVEIKHRISKPNSSSQVGYWMETGEVRFGPLITQVAVATDDVEMSSMQDEFLRFHDRKTRRLDFLWDFDSADSPRKISTGMTSILDSVRVMKSWGCPFFTPLTSKHPTFYYENENQQTRSRHKTGFKLEAGLDYDITDAGSHDSDDEEDVFDTRMDHGMSLLINGKQLLLRSKLSMKDTQGQSTSIAAGTLLLDTEVDQPQVEEEVEIPPRELVKLKSPSCDDFSRINRAISTESNLYQSAESEFKSSSTISSETYFSAESDVEVNAESLVKSETDLSEDRHRPEYLEITRPSVVRRLVLNDGSEPTKLSDIIEDQTNACKKPLIENEEMISCYSNVLTSSNYHDSDWLSGFDDVRAGIHPSVIIEKESHNVNLHRRCSMDVLDGCATDNCTSVVVHVKGGIDMQFTPFLLESLQQVIDAVNLTVAKQHPLSVVNQMQIKCTSDAVTRHELEKLEKNEAVGDVFVESLDKPGTKIEIYMDSVRLNIVQATLGNDPVFNLRLNKMLPTPCATVLGTRLDHLDLKFELHSKRDRMLSKVRKKKHSSCMNNSEEADDQVVYDDLESNLVDFLGHASVHSLACQLRVLNHDGCAPERSNVTALPDDACRAPFKFDEKSLLPDVKISMERYGDFLKRPPKPWGWVMIEAGIKKISAQLVKHDTKASIESSSNLPLCEGDLNVDLLWLNVVSPPSPSQLSRSSRAYRSWNILTSLAPSFSAWMAPADHVIGAIEQMEETLATRCYATISAALTMALGNSKKVGKSSWEPKKHKYDVIMDASRAIISDNNCMLCDALQRFLLVPEHARLLESAVNDERGIPALVTMETGIQVVIGQWFQLMTKVEASRDKSAKKRINSTPETPHVEQNVDVGIKFDGNLNLSTLIHSPETPSGKHVDDVTENYDITDEHASLVSTSPLQRHIQERAEELVYEQQQSMYSWMQNQTQNDIEAQTESRKKFISSSPEQPRMKNQIPFDECKQFYSHFLANVGVQKPSSKNTNFIQSNFGGSISVKARLRNIRIDKHEPDKMYSRDGARRRKRDPTSLRQRKVTISRGNNDGIELPIMLCQDLVFDVTVIDTLFDEKADGSEDADKNNKSSNNNVKKKKSPLFAKAKSKLSVSVGCSLELMKQRVDIALVRLVHQFVQCSDTIQQAMTDMQVNKYTAGSISPDVMLIHRRATSNISTNTVSSYADQMNSKHILRRRHTSPVTPRFPTSETDSTISSSTGSEALAPCWQELYKMVDMYSTDAVRFQDDLRFESELRRGFSSITRSSLHPPYVSLEISASLTLAKLQFLAEVGNLKVTMDLCDLSTTASHTRTSVSPFRYEAKSSMQAGLEKIHADITEHVVNMKQTIVTGNVGVCVLDASTNHQRDSDIGNNCSLLIGQIEIDLPQHPASLHDVVTRGSRQLSNHILEFARTPSLRQSFDAPDGGFPPVVTPSVMTFPPVTPMTPSAITAIIDLSQDSSEVTHLPVIVSLSLSIKGIEVGANLLPSLRARYITSEISGKGISGCDASFTVAMPTHNLHFASDSSSVNEFGPVSTDIQLPPISAEGAFKQHKVFDATNDVELQMKEGEYLSVSMQVGSFEHTLTTDVLNQLVFLQEVFMHEVNDLIQKMSRGNKPASQWSDSSLKSAESTQERPMLYQLQFQLDGIQITASTPSRNAVRLKTGTMTFELSNRVMRGGNKFKNIPNYLKLFGKAQVELNLALGTLVDNSVYPEVEPEFHQMAYFTTRVGLQNTTQSHDGSRVPGLSVPSKSSEDNNVILMSLVRPIFFVQPTAFDKAILIFLAYKNAYEEWTERRMTLEGDIRHSTKQVVNALQSRRSTQNASTVTTSNLFLQLSVHDLGICLPVPREVNAYTLSAQDELSSALVLTIDSTLISACYAKSLVTTGHFKGFCLRFADDFLTSLDDWAPQNNPVNSFIVPDGTYQICTDTTSYQGQLNVTARTSVNVVWQMKGVDVQLDTKIGAYLGHLIDTLTLITGQDIGRDSSASDKLNLESESESLTELEATSSADVIDGKAMTSSVPSPSRELSIKDKTKKIEQEYYEQIRVVNDLRSLGAKHSTIEEQERRLHELEGAISSMFRQTFKNKLRRSSVKKETLKRPAHHRSVSAGVGLRKFSPIKSAHSAYATLPPRVAHEQNNDSDSYTSPGGSDDVFASRFASFDAVHESSEDSSSDFDSDEVDGPGREFPQTKNEFDNSYDRTSFAHSMNQTTGFEADLELILDIRVGIDGGKIVCQPMKENQQTAPFRPPLTSNKTYESNDTTFYVPGVEVKIRYNSELGEGKPQEFFTPPGSPKNVPKIPVIQVETPGGTKTVKKQSCVYVWFSLQSLPEMIISPCFLDFLEQTLHFLPTSPSASTISSQSDEQGAVDAFNSTLASLPVDVVVFVSVQPSQVLFNCQPMSRVECLLHIPSLDVIFSSIRDSPSDISTSSFTFPDKSKSSGSPPQQTNLTTRAFPSGLGFTAVMSDFSIYVFHPYGAQPSMADQKGGSGRKDSLSVDLEVVKINIVRTRKGALSLDASLRLKENAIVVNISTLIDIGKASFKYDMRRLSEILAFPRAWYRRSIARRLFFGEVSDDRSKEEKFPDSPLTPKRSLPPKTNVEPREAWQGVVLFGLKISQIDVGMNMSNVMGNTLWSCEGLWSQGKLSLQSSGDKDIFLSCGVENSQLSAKGGIIGGSIELQRLYANCHLLEPIQAEPRHKVCVKMRSLDGRIEYMGGCIMMGTLTMVSVKLGDEWEGPKLSNHTSTDKSTVFVPGEVGWENFSLAISRSTTPDVIKMLAKLEEFFTQQFQNSVRALSSWRQPGRREATLSRQSSISAAPETYAHHRHWPAVYSAIRSLGVMHQFLLGGSLCLHGHQLTIVCFHGNNFRSRSWILFNILEPNIMFSTEVQEIKESITRDEASTHAIQSLAFNLGHDYWLKTASASSNPMTTVSRVTRSRHENPPPSGASIDEWFVYVTASHNQEQSMLQTLNDLRPNESGVNRSPAGGSTRTSSTSNYSHETDIIFALPKLQLDFKTEHMQSPQEPDPEDPDNKPIVECSFVTEFTDHICVTMDVELIMSLHDLISSYLKEKQQALSSRTRLTSEHATIVDPIDLREFICNTWQLEPTVRLISWAGRRIEPVGVDYILQKLGFRHARTTIPKWFQRGVLDVLDQTLAVIIQNLVIAMTQQKK